MQKFKFDWSATKQKMSEPQAAKQSFKKDERIFSPEFSKQGTVNVLLRFLPPMRDSKGNLSDVDFPFCGPVYYHNISENKRFLNVSCPTSIGEPCPICEFNKDNWDDYTKAQKKRSRKLNYYSNVLIIEDKTHPENNGKVFIFRYGKKIYDKMQEKSNPPVESFVKQGDYWDYYEGNNFQLSIKKIKLPEDDFAQNNYDSCCFESEKTPIAKTDEEIEAIMSKCYPLKPFIAEESFESYDKLKEKFQKFIVNTSKTKKTVVNEDNAPEEDVTPDIGETLSVDDSDDIFKNIQDNE
jgi:hypothetical protein